MQVKTKDKLIPELRFSSFKKDWIIKLYGDIYNFYSTNSFSRNKLNYESGKVYNIHYGDIHTKFSSLFDITKELTPLINYEVDLSKCNEEKYCVEGDLVVADASEDYGDIGKTIELINLDNKKVLAGLHTFLARPNKYKMAKGFATFLMQTWKVRKQIMLIAQGTKVLGISTGRLGKVKLSIPEYEEQKKIASFLTSVDDKLNQLTKKKELLERYKKGVIQKIFSQELRFKDDNGNKYPDWEEKKLGEVLIEINEKTTVSNQYKLLSSTKNGIFAQSDYFTRNIASKDNTGYKILKKNQLVFSPQNLWLGNINLNIYFDIGIVSPSYKIFDFSADIEISYFKDLLKTPKMLYEYTKVSEQGASVVRRNLDMNSFKAIKLKVPTFKEQKKIANFLSAIDKKIDLVSTQIENTKAFKKGLLQQMFV